MANGLSFSRVRAGWGASSIAWKFLWGSLLFLALALAVLFWWAQAGARDYRVLFAGLSDRDGGEVVQALEKLRIPYRLSEPGGAVEVPADALHLARYKLAVLGLPKGDRPAAEAPGMRFGLSPFQEQAGYQRALENELARSIELVDGIKSARVHLALPRQSAFLRERVPPSASVLLTLKPGLALLAPERIEAVRLIVAGSVPGMDAAQVNVLGPRGALTADPDAQSIVVAPAVVPDPPSQPVRKIPPAQAAEPVAAQSSQTGGWLHRLSGFPSPLREILAGLLLAVLAAWLMLWRARSRRLREALSAAEEAGAQPNLDARLEKLGQQVAADPRVAASVIRLWMGQA